MCIFFFFFFFQIQSLFILQQLQNKYIQLILIMVIGTDDCVCVVFVWEQTWEYPEETHLSNLVTTWPSHMRHLISNPAVNGERFTTVPVRQPCVSALTTTCNTLSKLIVTSIFHIEQLQILNFSFLYHHTVTV